MSYTSKMFPSEFDYNTQLEAYSSILDDRVSRKLKMHCKSYSAWKSVFKVAYNSINDKSSKEQLEWAFRTHLRRKEFKKEYIIGVGLVLSLGLITYYQPIIELLTNALPDIKANPQLSDLLPHFIIILCFMIVGDLMVCVYNKTINYILFDTEAIRLIETELKK